LAVTRLTPPREWNLGESGLADLLRVAKIEGNPHLTR
jgi:hypothetical protein